MKLIQYAPVGLRRVSMYFTLTFTLLWSQIQWQLNCVIECYAWKGIDSYGASRLVLVLTLQLRLFVLVLSLVNLALHSTGETMIHIILLILHKSMWATAR